MNRVLLKINIAICALITVGMLFISITGYRTNSEIFKENIEKVTYLTSDAISNRIQSVFAKPINISLTMANDKLLINMLKDEGKYLDEEEYVRTICDYLKVYKEKYEYDTLFLISTKTNLYYTYNGIDRMLNEDNPEDEWFYEFLKSDVNYNIEIDVDQSAVGNTDTVTVFIDCSIRDQDDTILGIVGLGFGIDFFQQIIREYEEEFGLKIYLVDEYGQIMISESESSFDSMNFFDLRRNNKMQYEIFDQTDEIQTFWETDGYYYVSKYVSEASWYLVIEHDTEAFEQQARLQLERTVITGFLLIVLFIVFSMITHRYNKKIIELTVSREEKRVQQISKQAELDGMTMIYNKLATEQHIKQILSDNADGNYAFFIIDVDDFKNVNDQYGHAFGDQVIVKCAEVIKQNFRNDDIIGRIGGDEFVVFVPMSNIDWVIEKADKLVSDLNMVYTNDAIECRVSSSIGIAITKGNESFEELYINADSALYKTKKRGKNGYFLYRDLKY